MIFGKIILVAPTILYFTFEISQFLMRLFIENMMGLKFSIVGKLDQIKQAGAELGQAQLN